MRIVENVQERHLPTGLKGNNVGFTLGFSSVLHRFDRFIRPEQCRNPGNSLWSSTFLTFLTILDILDVSVTFSPFWEKWP